MFIEDFKFIFVYLGVAWLSYASCRRSALGMIKQIGTVSRYFPKHYMVPPKWMKKFFRIRQRVIPRYLCFELLVSLACLFFGLINSIIFAAIGCASPTTGILFMVYVCLILLDRTFFIIMSFLYDRK